jgi:hypothetical protein
MVELKEKASSYAEENVLEVLKEAFAKVYADGYADGYKDCQDHVSVNLRISNTKYVDLGLPSGTLWSADYEKDVNGNIFEPYELASTKAIPTRAQWNELRRCAKWEFIGKDDKLEIVKCTGPNGNVISFLPAGGIDFIKKVRSGRVLFWVNSTSLKNCAVHLWEFNNEGHEDTDSQKSDLKLPLRLVRTK